jgi:hypothetical protein
MAQRKSASKKASSSRTKSGKSRARRAPGKSARGAGSRSRAAKSRASGAKSRASGAKSRASGAISQASTSKARRTEGRVMHEFKHGELKSGPAGKGGKVKSRKQAIAIALSEAGESKYKTKAQNRRAKSTTARKEAAGRTAQQEKEGRKKIGARGKTDSTRAMGGRTKAPKSHTNHASM